MRGAGQCYLLRQVSYIYTLCLQGQGACVELDNAIYSDRSVIYTVPAGPGPMRGAGQCYLLRQVSYIYTLSQQIIWFSALPSLLRADARVYSMSGVWARYMLTKALRIPLHPFQPWLARFLCQDLYFLGQYLFSKSLGNFFPFCIHKNAPNEISHFCFSTGQQSFRAVLPEYVFECFCFSKFTVLLLSRPEAIG